MNVVIDKYKFVISQKEVWTLYFALKHSLMRRENYVHAAQHEGWDTFAFNYEDEIEALETISLALLRPELYASIIADIKSEIDKEITKRKMETS